MIRILQIDSSIFGEQGVSPQLVAKLVKRLSDVHSEVKVSYRNLPESKIPHFDAATIHAINEGKAKLADQLIGEIQQTDVLVLGVPMYNFGVPSQLKAWFDHIARAGVTFRYTENGPVGLLKGKKVYIVTTRGGLHKNTNTDVEVPFLKTMLNFLGLDDIEFIYAEGLAMGDETRTQSIARAETEIEKLAKSNPV